MPTSTDPRINQWISFSDFTPGCFSYSPISGYTAVAPAPLGAADARYTVRCIALPNGGLAPLGVRVTYGASLTTLPYTTFPTNKLYITQFASQRRVKTHTEIDCLFIKYEGYNNTTRKAFSKIVTFIPNVSGFVTVSKVSISTYNSTYKMVAIPFSPLRTRMNNKATATKPGHPVIITMQLKPTTKNLTTQTVAYPTWTTPTVAKLRVISTNGSYTAVAYQGRILLINSKLYSTPYGTIWVNETFNYTTPSNSPTLGNQNVVIDPTDPFGYGSWGSISAGELFLVKKRGGGVLLTGDINYPTITKLPGVQSTGYITGTSNAGSGPCVSTPAGLFYPSEGDGIWLWNGGNISQKVSQNLQNDFYRVAPYFQFFGYCWGEMVMFSNMWLYDLRTQGWWKWSTGPAPIYWYAPSVNPTQLYCAPCTTQLGSSVKQIYRINKSLAARTYIWQSLPNKLTQNRYINVREIVLYASNPYSNTSTIKVQLFNGSTTVFSYQTTKTKQPIHADPTMIRIPCGGVTLNNAIIRVTATGPTGAPIIHSITLGCTIRQHVQTVGS